MKVKLTIGDWSQDGHNQYDEFVFEVNKDVTEVRQAYKDSCFLTKCQFHEGNNYTGITYNWENAHLYQSCVEYEDDKITEIQIGKSGYIQVTK